VGISDFLFISSHVKRENNPALQGPLAASWLPGRTLADGSTATGSPDLGGLNYSALLRPYLLVVSSDGS